MLTMMIYSKMIFRYFLFMPTNKPSRLYSRWLM